MLEQVIVRSTESFIVSSGHRNTYCDEKKAPVLSGAFLFQIRIIIF